MEERPQETRELADLAAQELRKRHYTRVRAREAAEGRADYYVLTFNPEAIRGPLDERTAQELIDSMLDMTRTPKLLKVIEDYEI